MIHVLLADSGAAIAIVPIAIIGVAFLALFTRLGAGSMDHDRIRDHVQQQGGEVRSIDWAPFGRGWAGSKEERIYEVIYSDADKNVHKAYCKTKAMAGVYWTEDTIIEASSDTGSKPVIDASALAAENQRLREEIERLKKNS